MSKTVKQLTETTTAKTYDITHIVDIDNDQDKKIKMANVWNTKPYGEMYLNSNATVSTHAVANTWYDISAGGVTTTAGVLNKFTHSGANCTLTYTGEEDVTVKIDAILTVAQNSTLGTNREHEFRIKSGGASQSKATIRQFLIGSGGSNQYYTVAISCVVTLSKNDEVEIESKQITGTDGVIVREMNVNVTTL